MDSEPLTEGPQPSSPAPEAFGDRFRSVPDVLEQVIHDDNLPEGPVELIEIHLHASGDASVRFWEARASEWVGSYYPPADSP